MAHPLAGCTCNLDLAQFRFFAFLSTFGQPSHSSIEETGARGWQGAGGVEAPGVRRILHLVRIYLEAALPSPARFYPPPSFTSFHSFSHREPSPPSILAKQKATGHASGSPSIGCAAHPSTSSQPAYLAFSAGPQLKTKRSGFLFLPRYSPSALFLLPPSRPLRMDKRPRDSRFRVYYSECGATFRSD